MSEDAAHKSSWLTELKNLLLLRPHSEAELLNVLQTASEEKLLDAGTLKMMQGVLAISKMQVKDIMIPRPQMASLQHDQPMDAMLKTIIAASHSRFPVLGENQDDVIGILIVKDFLKAYAEQKEKPLDIHNILRPAFFVPESKRLDSLLNEFKSSRNHLAIVVDEYGGISGLATIEDILEEIVGDIEDEFDIIEENKIVPLADHHYQAHALAHLDEINEVLGTHFDDHEGEVDTIGGLVTIILGRVPVIDDTVAIDEWQIKVTKANERRVLQVELQRL
jgi:magnesium and cobalt transporter